MHLKAVVFKVKSDKIGDLLFVVNDDYSICLLFKTFFKLFNRDIHAA